MALVVTQGPNNLSVVLDGTTDFLMTAYLPRGVRLTAVRWFANAVNDTLIIREETVAGVQKAKMKDTVGSGQHFECTLRKPCKPAIKANEGTSGTLVIFEFD
jgi:hypothetical protein